MMHGNLYLKNISKLYRVVNIVMTLYTVQNRMDLIWVVFGIVLIITYTMKVLAFFPEAGISSSFLSQPF
jgi:hypothetical protein